MFQKELVLLCVLLKQSHGGSQFLMVLCLGASAEGLSAAGYEGLGKNLLLASPSCVQRLCGDLPFSS